MASGGDVKSSSIIGSAIQYLTGGIAILVLLVLFIAYWPAALVVAAIGGIIWWSRKAPRGQAVNTKASSDQIVGNTPLMTQQPQSVPTVTTSVPTPVVIDFKTSKEEPIKEEGIDLQLDLYALGAEKSLGYQVGTTTVHFLGDGQVMQFTWSQQRKEKALDMLKSILDSIIKQEFPHNRSYCSRCQEFRNICPYYSCPNGVENSP